MSQSEENYTEVLSEDTISLAMKEHKSFANVLDIYLLFEKNRILGFHKKKMNTLSKYSEYATENEEGFFSNEVKSIWNLALQVLNYEDKINEKKCISIAKKNHFLAVIEGLYSMALYPRLSEKFIDQQFEILRKLIL